MAFDTATNFKTAVQDWLDRADYSAVADDMILLAEAHLNYELNCREMVTETDITPSSGVCALPADFLSVIKLVALTTPRRVLHQIGISMADSKHDESVSGVPVDYAIIGENIHTYPSSSYDVELTYKQKLPPLASNDSNWLLAAYPNIYLSACMMEAHRYFRNADELGIEAQRITNMIERINNNSMLEYMGDATRTLQGHTP